MRRTQERPDGGPARSPEGRLGAAPAACAPGGPERGSRAGTVFLIIAGGFLALTLLIAAASVLGATGLGILALLASGIGLGAYGARRLGAGGASLRERELAARLDAAEAACRAAEAESAAKSRFLAEMSHELRTPLNTVMGFSEMMAQEVLGPHRIPAYGGYARDILASARHLLALADDLLDLARIESGHRVLLETAVPVDLLARECLAMMAPEAKRRGLVLRADGAPLRLWADERALRQMLLNLLANAVKFTPEGGEVRLAFGLAEGAPFVRVEDTGRGLAERELPLDDARHRESRVDLASGRGAGLGLAIVEGLAALHGGSLSLTRRAGGGTRASLSLPESRVMAQEPAALSGAAA
ncbi:HAMP domain-containing sensor histidine kinase [Xanthobacter sp. KR7-225]|uniref:sensor histidine kinase n=1 Tax=Xanthobacter sp. KR7-225 TaxID=3156613 RepID=UPI0032B3D044